METKQRSDKELLIDFVQGDSKALEILIKRHERRVFTYILLMVRNSHLAEDLMQDTFVKAIKSVKCGNYSEINRFQPWLIRIAHNLVIDYFRRNKHYREISNDDYEMDIFNSPRFSEQNVEEQLVFDQLMGQVRSMIDRLPEEQREVVMLRYYGELSFKEIAESTNVSINTALGRMRYALINLRKLAREKNLQLHI